MRWSFVVAIVHLPKEIVILSLQLVDDLIQTVDLVMEFREFLFVWR